MHDHGVPLTNKTLHRLQLRPAQVSARHLVAGGPMGFSRERSFASDSVVDRNELKSSSATGADTDLATSALGRVRVIYYHTRLNPSQTDAKSGTASDAARCRRYVRWRLQGNWNVFVIRRRSCRIVLSSFRSTFPRLPGWTRRLASVPTRSHGY